MNIAISVTEDNGPASEVSARFGRAKGFMLVDTETDSHTYVANDQNLNAVQGAGIQSARNVLDAGAEGVITTHCGPKAFRTLLAAGAKIYLGSFGTVAEALEAWKQGKLKATDSPDVEGHWG